MSKCVMFVAAVATVLSVDGTSAMKLSLDSRMVVKGAVDHDHAHEHDPTSAAAEAAKESITEHKPAGDHDADPNEVETYDPKKKTEDEKTVSKNNMGYNLSLIEYTQQIFTDKIRFFSVDKFRRTFVWNP